jgi:cytochrome c biogenesis protein CcdA
MIGQITPLVKAAGRQSWAKAVGAYCVGATLSAGFLGLFLGTLGSVLGSALSPRIVVGGVGALILFCALQEGEVTQCALPTFRRQTPKNFMCAFGPIWGPFAWGLELGQRWTTHIEFYGYYGIVIWALVTGHPALGAMVVGAYGLGRGVSVLEVGMNVHRKSSGSPETSYLFHSTLIHKINAFALAFAGAFALAGMVS